MDSRIPPRPLHRLHPAITRPPTGKRLALTSPRRPLQRDNRRSLPRLHQPANLPATTLPLDLRRIPRWPNRRRKNPARLPSRHDSVPLNTRRTRTRGPHNLPEHKPLNTIEPATSTTRLLDHKRRHRTRRRRHHPHTDPRTTWQTLPAKPGNRTRHARRSKRQPTNDKPRPLQQRPRPRQQLRRKQPLTLHNQQQLLTTLRRQLVSRHTKLHPRTILTTRPDHILHRRPSDHPDRI